MKTTSAFTLLMAAATVMAAPAKRQTYQAEILSSIKAVLTSTSGSFELVLDDLNYNETTTIDVNWDRPGEPPMENWSADGNYMLYFPTNVTSVEQLQFVIDRALELQFAVVYLNSEAEDSEWTCGTFDGAPGTQQCYISADLTVVPTTTS
ncbi:uncharacterized protein N7483_010283 [Penicillium malachiteum]|uniref:uncharacterized protein n=1 Tax=Penicillium malachiteum TaxID=1324776 RepID=UPI0025467053|nr:uncharacterized protein N7483_010283 [Penicillium malachiteum]KAJ5713102.1 hypothetical protein N7483_010283 [Penicillium malachiteum]